MCKVSFSNTIVSDYVINGDHDIINKTSLRDVIAKGLIYSQPKSINIGNVTLKSPMDSAEDYARQWA